MEGNKGIDLHGTTEVAKQRRNRVFLIGIDAYWYWREIQSLSND